MLGMQKWILMEQITDEISTFCIGIKSGDRWPGGSCNKSIYLVVLCGVSAIMSPMLREVERAVYRVNYENTKAASPDDSLKL